MLIAYYVGTVAIRTISYIIETEVYRAKIERNINAFFYIDIQWWNWQNYIKFFPSILYVYSG